MNEHQCSECNILTIESVKNIAELFSIEFKELREDIFIQGSPERCVIRTVFEDIKGDLYIIENLSKEMRKNKIKIAETLSFLSSKELFKIAPYIKNENDEFIIEYKKTFFQIMPYIKGFDLPRPSYTSDSWRGAELGEFLLILKEKSENIESNVKGLDKKHPFSLKNYVYLILETIKEYDLEYHSRVKPIVDYLKNGLMKDIDKIPITFSHGDFHPINIIWGDNRINSVIDWEFSGFKNEIYDISNLIGCIGIEDPNALTKELVGSLIKTAKKGKLIHESSWDYLVDYIIANRFAWLSEWFRKKDIEMIDLEIVYMNILIQNKEKLTRFWKAL